MRLANEEELRQIREISLDSIYIIVSKDYKKCVIRIMVIVVLAIASLIIVKSPVIYLLIFALLCSDASNCDLWFTNRANMFAVIGNEVSRSDFYIRELSPDEIGIKAEDDTRYLECEIVSDIIAYKISISIKSTRCNGKGIHNDANLEGKNQGDNIM